MFDSEQAQRRVGTFAWVMAWFGLVAGQLHALARHNTVDGRGDLKSPLVRAWSDPARAALKPLLDWANPDAVYLTYGKIWLPVFLGFTLCAFVLHRRRTPMGFEKWGWRVALVGYVWACLSVFGDYWLQWGAHGNDTLLTITFVAGLPGLLVMLIGSTMLGIALLRNGFRPRATSWLLTLAIPLAVAALMVTSMGSAALPVMFAFGIAGRRLARRTTEAPVAEAAVVAG